MKREEPRLYACGAKHDLTRLYQNDAHRSLSMALGVSSKEETVTLQEYALLGLLVLINSMLGVAFASAGVYRLQLKSRGPIHVRECLK